MVVHLPVSCQIPHIAQLLLIYDTAHALRLSHYLCYITLTNYNYYSYMTLRMHYAYLITTAILHPSQSYLGETQLKQTKKNHVILCVLNNDATL